MAKSNTGKKCEYLVNPDKINKTFHDCRANGMTYAETAKVIGTTRTNLRRWMNVYPELAELDRECVDIQQEGLERAMFKRALGFEYTEVTTEAKTDASGNVIEKHIKNVKKFVPPSETAGIFLLTNIQNSKWKRNPDTESDDDKARQDVTIE